MPRFNHAAAVSLYRDGHAPAAIATRLGVTIRAVVRVLERQAGYHPRRRRVWQEQETAALGTRADAAVAQQQGRQKPAVQSKRWRAGIPAAHPRVRWAPEEDRIVLRHSAAEAARLLPQRTRHAIEIRRSRLQQR